MDPERSERDYGLDAGAAAILGDWGVDDGEMDEG